jgi:AraC-like DNA-binding protein
LLILAEKLNTNKSYLSQVINEYFRKNFSTFVNEYRVKEASRLLLEKESENYTIEAIANSVGFKSKSAFNSAFKKFTGITPSYFVNSTKG